VALTSTTLSATYSVPSTSYQVALNASGPCWVLVKATATGDILWTGTLQPGAQQLIRASGPVAVELGSLTIALAIDNVPVLLPTPLHTPFTASFEPATSPAGGTTTTTPAPTTTTTAGASGTSAG